MNSADVPMVSWRDYLHAVVEKETGIVLARLAAIDQAWVIQARELARRLDELNHAHQRSQEDRATFVSKATFEPFQQQVLDRLSENKGRDMVIAVIVATATSILVMLAAFLLRR